MRLLVQDAPEGYSDLLAPLPVGAEVISKEQAEAAFLQLFLRDLGDLESLTPDVLKVCGKNSLLWITYPKVSVRSAHGLSRNIVREALRKIGWRAVTIVAVDSTCAALRFRPIKSLSVSTKRTSQKGARATLSQTDRFRECRFQIPGLGPSRAVSGGVEAQWNGEPS